MSETAEQFRDRLINQYNEIARLAGALAHEIKNPLSTIRLNLDLMVEDLDPPESQKERRTLVKLETVRGECKRLQNLLDEFLNFARARQLQLRPGNLNKVVQSVLDFFLPAAVESGIDLSAYLANDLPSVMLDEESLYRALLNLIINAQQAICHSADKTPQSAADSRKPVISTDSASPNESGYIGRILVRTHAQGDCVVLEIIDDGPGMNKAVWQKCFDAFYSTKRGGSGLGLPTVKQVVEAHGGTIELQSEEGKGTRFTIVFPLLPRLETEDK